MSRRYFNASMSATDTTITNEDIAQQQREMFEEDEFEARGELLQFIVGKRRQLFQNFVKEILTFIESRMADLLLDELTVRRGIDAERDVFMYELVHFRAYKYTGLLLRGLEDQFFRRGAQVWMAQSLQRNELYYRVGGLEVLELEERGKLRRKFNRETMVAAAVFAKWEQEKRDGVLQLMPGLEVDISRSPPGSKGRSEERNIVAGDTMSPVRAASAFENEVAAAADDGLVATSDSSDSGVTAVITNDSMLSPQQKLQLLYKERERGVFLTKLYHLELAHGASRARLEWQEELQGDKLREELGVFVTLSKF